MHKENQMPARDDCLMRRWRNKSVVVGSGWSAVMNGLKSHSGWSHYLFVSPYTCLDMTFHNVPPPTTFIRGEPRLCADACTQLMSQVRARLCSRSYEQTLVSFFLLIKLLRFSDSPSTPHFSVNSSRFWPFCWMHAHPHITCTRVQRQPVMDGVITCSFKGQKGA